MPVGTLIVVSLKFVIVVVVRPPAVKKVDKVILEDLTYPHVQFREVHGPDLDVAQTAEQHVHTRGRGKPERRRDVPHDDV